MWIELYYHMDGNNGCGDIIKGHKGNVLETFIFHIKNEDPLTT